MLQIGVKLDLIDSWRHFCLLEERFKMLWQVIGHTNRPGFAGFLDVFHRFPCRLDQTFIERSGWCVVGIPVSEEGLVDEISKLKLA
jgi:hypothetical protein